MQKVDLIVNGKLVNINQRSDNTALLNRIHTAIQTASDVTIRRTRVTVPNPQPKPNLPPARNVVFVAEQPLSALKAPSWCIPALTADPAYPLTDDDVYQLRKRFPILAAWGVQTQIGAQRMRDFQAAHGLDYIIWQGETSAEYQTAIENGAGVIVGNSNAWTDDQRLDAIKRISAGSLAFIFETYTNEGDPWPKDSSSGGVPPASFCLGLYAAKSHPTLADYKANTPVASWPSVSVYHSFAVTDWQNL